MTLNEIANYMKGPAEAGAMDSGDSLGKTTARFEPCNVRGCWETAEREMNKWIANDKAHTGEKGVSGVLGALERAGR